MATPITHFILSEKIFEKKFKLYNKKDFLLWTILPDIRYLGVIKREESHFIYHSLEDIQKIKTSSSAWIRFHSLLDIKREENIIKKWIYNLIWKDFYTITALKLLEDTILYNKLNIAEYLNYFDIWFNEKVELNIKNEEINKWNIWIKKYFSSKPSNESIKEFSKFINLNTETADKIINRLCDLKNERFLIEYTEDLYDNFDSIIL